jgi:energy-coupling factor transporter transmembrane protein EcfT
MIQWTIKLAGQFDILFKNSFGMPFFFGFSFFFVLLGVLIFYTIRLAIKKNWNFLKLAMWSFAFVLLGFSTYYTTLIRSNADPSVDMFNVDNPVSLVGYLGREQYGDWPLIYGQDFTAETTQDSKTVDTYVKSKNSYEKKGKKYLPEYASEDKHFLPRMWDASNDQSHADYYLGFTDNVSKDPKTGAYEGKPTMADNIKFAFAYQINWMYLRYFMWNFAGKQNDIQGMI